MEAKHWTESRTIRWNALIAAMTVLLSNVELLRNYVGDGGYLLLMMAASAGNVYLRSMTREPVRFRK